ncbi:hypothetical protein PHYPSEUDO_002400 [Phytophthora pseudosyringae]|uniref:Uncharacterized protein n=1 Tax=Phytophthora pseudosyringae TaxID=221518 RepID=A0A8T1VXH4_9STRA|nr:hypothetical protein PHYPSEUDO_002400 [Phytophthora pseudosyringae]
MDWLSDPTTLGPVDVQSTVDSDDVDRRLVARCMALDCFRSRNLTNGWIPEALAGSRVNFGSRHVLQGIVNAVDDQVQAIVAYEDEPYALVQLAQTGYIVQQISRLNRLLDVALAVYNIPEPRQMIKW